MSLDHIKVLAFDTGGSLFDRHSGFRGTFAAARRRHGVARDWAAIANALRRRSMAAMVGLGQHGPPADNFDQAHRSPLGALLADEGLQVFDEDDSLTRAVLNPTALAASRSKE